jgi:hypothetical protein
MFSFLKHILVGERCIGGWQVLFGIACCFATPATDATGQINQHPESVRIFFNIMAFSGFGAQQHGGYCPDQTTL